MMFPSPFYRENRGSASAVRWFAGVSITATCQRIESAMIGIHGRGSGAPVEIRKTIAFDIPREITDSFNNLQQQCTSSAHTNREFSPFLFRHVARELANIEEEAIQELLGESRLAANDLMAVGVHDPGLHILTPRGIFYQGLCDVAYLAEQTGLNIVDSFPAQDIAAEGNGGPLFPLPAWIFLKSETHDRIFLDLGRTARLTYLPKAENAFSPQKIRHFDLIPCGSLLDTLLWQLTGGKTNVDAGGHFAVQGCQDVQLMSELRQALQVNEQWTPLGLQPERYLQIAEKAAQMGLSYQDVLCTVSGFIAETVAKQVLNMIKKGSPKEPELLFQGSCGQHGLLINSLASQLQNRTLIPMVQFGIPVDTFDSLCTAMLTSLTIDHVPGNLPHLTGSETTKLLGRLTPGSLGNWHRLLREMAETKPSNRTLRSAM